MGSSSEDKFCLKWNDFDANVAESFRSLRRRNRFFDVSLVLDSGAADFKVIPAHKVILATCSPFFDALLSRPQQPFNHPNPMIFLRGVAVKDINYILDFVYHGEVNVAQDELTSFLAVAEDLKIKGLTQNLAQNDKPVHPPANDNRLKREAPSSDNDRPGFSAKKRSLKPTNPATPTSSNNDVEEIQVEPVKPEPSTSRAQVGGGDYEHNQEDFVDEDYGFDGSEEPDVEVSYDQDAMVAGGAIAGDTTKGSIEEILKRHTSAVEGGHLCFLCGKILRNGSVKKHFTDTHDFSQDKFACPICKKIYKNRNSFGNHLSVYHKLRGLKINSCIVPKDLLQ